VQGSDSDTVKSNLMRLFNVNDAKAAALLSGKRVVLKKNADQATAMKFRAALKQAGAVCELQSLEAPSSTAAPSSTSTESRSAPAPENVSAKASASTGDVDMVG